jgi:hypothetical protein
MPETSTPVPDPTVLTTEQLTRWLQSLRELLETRIGALSDRVDVHRAELDRLPSEAGRLIGQTTELYNVKFEAIQQQFRERDVRATASEQAATVAVSAALQAQKEAAFAQNEATTASITKSELATVKQIDGILALLASNTKAIDEKIASINGRLDRGEGGDSRASSSQGTLFSVIGIIIAVFAGGLALLNAIHASTAAPAPIVVQPQK